jgi:16S rRNA processing protein RimM
MSEFVRVGQIVGSFGLKGQLKVTPLTDFYERLAKGARLRLDGEWCEVTSSMHHKNHVVLTLDGITDRSAADSLKWKYLEAPKEDRPDLEEDEYLTEDLIGLQVVDQDGSALGTVDDVLAAPAHDILVVGEVMIPAVQQFIKKIDFDAEVISVELIPGMRPGED